ncbi:MAG: hypothetical protein ACREBR_00870, partial [bacterium]
MKTVCMYQYVAKLDLLIHEPVEAYSTERGQNRLKTFFRGPMLLSFRPTDLRPVSQKIFDPDKIKDRLAERCHTYGGTFRTARIIVGNASQSNDLYQFLFPAVISVLAFGFEMVSSANKISSAFNIYFPLPFSFLAGTWSLHTSHFSSATKLPRHKIIVIFFCLIMLTFSSASCKRKRALIVFAVILIQLNLCRKKPNKIRHRLDWAAHVADIGEELFQRAYRLTYASFNSLLVKI